MNVGECFMIIVTIKKYSPYIESGVARLREY